MSNSSNINGPSAISPTLGGVWKIRKNPRGDDRRNRNQNSGYEDLKDRDDKDTIEIKELETTKIPEISVTEQVRSKSETGDAKKQSPHKIDIII